MAGCDARHIYDIDRKAPSSAQPSGSAIDWISTISCDSSHPVHANSGGSPDGAARGQMANARRMPGRPSRVKHSREHSGPQEDAISIVPNSGNLAASEMPQSEVGELPCIGEVLVSDPIFTSGCPQKRRSRRGSLTAMTKTDADCLRLLPDRPLGSFHRLRHLNHRCPCFRMGFELPQILLSPRFADNGSLFRHVPHSSL